MTLLIIDCGIGNIGSIANMLNRLGVAAEVVGTRQELRRASRIVLPGVGSFNNGMRALHDRDLVEPLTERVLGDGVPVLGICLGLELMTRASEEGSTAGLGWLAADTRRFCLPPEAARLKVPHMGWNEIVCTAPALLTAGFAPAE
ncbi:MAG: imidazole glycerol phosphate synthase subunit HisH, partial [Alphaproteobacteria bacterium]|nr:imidazole glycerol phosphate synthase subunit HisH [Alphaproteobacteria bacterium]